MQAPQAGSGVCSSVQVRPGVPVRLFAVWIKPAWAAPHRGLQSRNVNQRALGRHRVQAGWKQAHQPGHSLGIFCPQLLELLHNIAPFCVICLRVAAVLALQHNHWCQP